MQGLAQRIGFGFYKAWLSAVTWLRMQAGFLLVQRWGYFRLFRRTRRTVLLIRPDHLGDLLITLSTSREFCELYRARGYRICILVTPAMKTIAVQCPFFDEVLECEPERDFASFRGRYRQFRQAYLLHPEIAVNMLCRDSAELDLVPLMSGARVKAGFQPHIPSHPKLPYKQLFLWYTRWKHYYNIMPPVRHEISIFDNESGLFEAIAGRHFDVTLFKPGCWELPTSGIDGAYYVISAGSLSHHPWPMERMARIIDKIYAKRGELTPVLTGTQAELPLGDSLTEYLKSDVKVVNLLGKTTLPQLFAVVRGASFVITNDTGMMHITPLYGVHAFCLCGVWLYGFYAPCPYYPHSEFINHPMPCMKGCDLYCCRQFVDGMTGCQAAVTVEQVWEHIERYLNIQDVPE